MVLFTKKDIHDTYHKLAGKYDLLAKLLILICYREGDYRKKAVASLNLHAGDTVVEIGCGTGMNFSLLRRYIGPTGKIIGVDLSQAMLEKAQQKVRQAGWENVELVHSDAAEFVFPQNVDGIISTFSLVFIQDFERLIMNGSEALKKGRRFVILDQKLASGRMRVFTPLFEVLVKPFAVTAEMADRRPWESVDKYLHTVFLKEYYLGYCYLVVGEKNN